MAGPRAEMPRLDGNALRLLLEAVPCGIILHDRRGRVLHANSSAEQIVGFDPRRARGLERGELLRPDGSPLPRSQRPNRLALRTRAAQWDVRVQFRRPDGQQRLLAVNCVPLLDAAGQLQRLVTAFFDETLAAGMEDLFQTLTGVGVGLAAHQRRAHPRPSQQREEVQWAIDQLATVQTWLRQARGR